MKENYRALTRAYRPKTFEDIVSQEHVSSTLKNAIRNDRLSHAYMFCGPRGVGKTTMARVLAREVNQVAASVDGEELGRTLNIVEMDAASNRKIDDVRALKEVIRVPPQNGRYKIFIIDEVHMLTKEAFNALLKTLEEPPAHAIFIFATTEPHKVLPTILSRVQRFDFKRIGVEEIISRLKVICSRESITIDDESLHVIARRADGALRDALGLMDQAIAFCGDEITYSELLKALNIVDRNDLFTLIDIIRERNSGAGLTLIGELIQAGTDIQEFLVTLTEHIRNLYVALDSERLHLVEATEATRERYVEQASAFSEDDLIRMLHLVSDAQFRIRDARQPRVQFEILLLKLIHMSRSTELGELIDGLRELKKNSGSERLNPSGGSGSREGSTGSRRQAAGAGGQVAGPGVPEQAGSTVPEQTAPGVQDQPDEPDAGLSNRGKDLKADQSGQPDATTVAQRADETGKSAHQQQQTGEPTADVQKQAASGSQKQGAGSAVSERAGRLTTDAQDQPDEPPVSKPEKEGTVQSEEPVAGDQEWSVVAQDQPDEPDTDVQEQAAETVRDDVEPEASVATGSDTPVDEGNQDDEETALFGRPTLFVEGQASGSARRPDGTNDQLPTSESVRRRFGQRPPAQAPDRFSHNSRSAADDHTGNGITEGIKSVHDVKERWKELLKVLEESAPPTLYFQMLRVEVSDFEGRTLTLSVDNAFARQLVEENQDVLSDCLKRVFGKRLSVACKVVRNEREEVQRMSPYERFMELQKKDPNIRTLVDLFGAELEY